MSTYYERPFILCRQVLAMIMINILCMAMESYKQAQWQVNALVKEREFLIESLLVRVHFIV